MTRVRQEAYFWPTARGHAVDLLIDRVVPFEIKLHSAPTLDHARGVVTCMEDLGLARGHMIYPESEAYSLGRQVTAIPADRFLRDPGEFLPR